MPKDGIRMTANWKLTKFKDPDGKIGEMLKAGASLDEIIAKFPDNFISSEAWKHNLALNEGLQELIDIICGIGTPTKWDSTNAYLGVGDSNTAASATQTGLLGSNKTYKAMDGTYPQKSSQTAIWRVHASVFHRDA